MKDEGKEEEGQAKEEESDDDEEEKEVYISMKEEVQHGKERKKIKDKESAAQRSQRKTCIIVQYGCKKERKNIARRLKKE